MALNFVVAQTLLNNIGNFISDYNIMLLSGKDHEESQQDSGWTINYKGMDMAELELDVEGVRELCGLEKVCQMFLPNGLNSLRNSSSRSSYIDL